MKLQDAKKEEELTQDEWSAIQKYKNFQARFDKSISYQTATTINAFKSFMSLDASATQLIKLFNSMPFNSSDWRGCTKSDIAECYLCERRAINRVIPFDQLVATFGVR